jgi:hypothetical protein
VKEMKKLLLLVLTVAMVVALSPGFGMAYATPSYYAQGSMSGVKYLTGGVGLSERGNMQKMAKDYNVHMVFADPAGAYLANVEVEIQNSNGKNLIQSYANGPWFFVNLPAGQYTITVTHNDKTKTRKLVVTKGAQEEMFHFKA